MRQRTYDNNVFIIIHIYDMYNVHTSSFSSSLRDYLYFFYDTYVMYIRMVAER